MRTRNFSRISLNNTKVGLTEIDGRLHATLQTGIRFRRRDGYSGNMYFIWRWTKEETPDPWENLLQTFRDWRPELTFPELAELTLATYCAWDELQHTLDDRLLREWRWTPKASQEVNIPLTNKS